MKKRILSFVLLMLMVLTSFASAADLGYVMSEGDISFTSVTFANDGTNVSASLNGIKAQGTDSVTLMMTVYNSKHKMVDASSDTKSVGTTEVELKATAPVPAGDFTLDATLFNTENGLSPIAAPAYSDYDGATDLLDLRVSGVTIDGFKPGVYEYGYITEGLTEYPEITATVREGSTKVTAAYEDTFPGVATITVANAKGATSVYKIDFTPLRHIVVGATSNADFDVDAGTNLNLVSGTAVSSGVGGKNLFTNLTGAPNDSLDFGSRWTTDFHPLGSHHAIRSIDPMLQGWDYFVCANGAMKKDAGNYFEFEVMHNARIVVVTRAAEPSLVANGFEALPSKLYAKASYVSGAASGDVRKDLNALGITPTYADLEFYNANAKDHTALVNYFADKYNLDTDVASENIPVNKGVGVSVFDYQTAYSKFYEAYEDEPAKVIIPAPEATQGRGYIVAVIPVGEDGELPGSGNQGGGGETPGTPDVPDEPDEPDTPDVPDEPVLAEGNHIIVGARYTDEIVADSDVTDGFKSAAAVTSAKSGRTDGVVYTNLRGTPDEAGTTYGARLCSMPANSTSYHEVYYADESLAGNDYFVFTAGGNAHSDNPLLKFDIVADAEVYIITTNSGLAFQGYTLEEKSTGWIKGRFINRNMADAMNAIGVKPTYSVVKTYKPAEKDAFYNTYLKAAYDSADSTAKAKFDEQWALFGTVGALGNDSTYKAAYKATFTVPEGEDKVTVTVPGNTSGASTRNILVVVKPIAEEGPDLSQDAEVLGVIAKINAIGEVTLDSEAAILDARAAYDALSEEKKAYVTNLGALEAAEIELEELKSVPVPMEGFHPIVGARYVSDFVQDTGVVNGKMSASKVTTAGNSLYNGYVYTNFRGIDETVTSGARWTTDSWTTPLKGQLHEVYYADESLVGYDYFVSTTGDKSYASSPLLEFKLAESAEVVILGMRGDILIDGFTREENTSSWAKARYFNSYYANAIRLLGVEPTWDKALNYSDATKSTFIENYYAAEYAALDDAAKAAFDTAWASVSGGVGGIFSYNNAYSRVYNVPEGETLTVTIPGDQSGRNHRTPIILVKPVSEEEAPVEPDFTQDAEVLDVIAKIDAIGEVTLDDEVAITEARAAYDALSEEKKPYVINLSVLEAAEDTLEELKAEAEQPVPVEGDHIIVGARMEGEIIADSGVTDGFKSAAAVTSAKSGRTDGVVYTNLRGTPDEAGTTYGARLCTMPANSTSYHEVYYADESLAGSDYFVFTAGGDPHSDGTLLKFDVVADAEVSILATSNAMAFDGFTLKENNAGWIKGRFINRNMADAMNAIGVTPVYSVVKTYKPAEKETFYNTYLKAAYESANAIQKAKFDSLWTLFGTVGAIGNDSTYKAMYTKTFILPEGEDTMTITVPGNTSGASSRNILVVVKTATGEEEVIPAEVTAVIELIDAIGEVTLDSEDAILHAREAYDALSGDNQALVTNYADLEAAEATLEELKANVEVEHVGALTSKVSGLTYAKYLEYIESVTGTKPTSTSVIKDTEVIATSTIVVRDSFTIGGQIGSESARRRLETINEDYAFLEGVEFFSPTIEWGQQADVRKWFTKLFWGQDATYTYDGFDYTVNAATDALPTVPWWTIPVTEATVYITSYVEMPHLEDAGWTKADTTDSVFTFKDTNNGAIGNGPSVVYTKEVTDTETVELPNSNTGVHGTYPYFVFFVPNN